MVRFARVSSPFYRRHYRLLPDSVDDVTTLPVTNKSQLMDNFDDWVTNPVVHHSSISDFLSDPATVGRPFAGAYTVTTTSGTTGTHGIFLQDERSMAVVSAMALRMLSVWLSVRDLGQIVSRGGRMAMVIPTQGHFGSTVAAARLRSSRRGRGSVGVFSVHQPPADLVAELNHFRPALLASYATTAALLADEAEHGRLNIDPVLTVLTAEGLPEPEYGRIAAALHTKVRSSYAANECPFLSSGCKHEWQHVNADWVILEPVDEHHQPVPPGEQSYTTLITNLANRIQPVLRYDIGDSVVLRPDPCPCGNPLPAVRVQGRAADVVTFTKVSGEQVSLAPLVLSTLVESIPGISLFQIVQTGPAALGIRLSPSQDADPAVLWPTVTAELTQLLTRHGLAHVSVKPDVAPPQQSPGGKYRTVIPQN